MPLVYTSYVYKAYNVVLPGCCCSKAKFSLRSEQFVFVRCYYYFFMRQNGLKHLNSGIGLIKCTDNIFTDIK